MPDIPVSSPVLDLAFHPNEDLVYTAHLNGQVTARTYDENGETSTKWKARVAKKSARAIDISPKGDALWCGYKSGMMCTFDPATGRVLKDWAKAHDTPISRISALGETMHTFASGDDNGSIKLWDTRSSISSKDAVRTYTHHTDYISDFVWIPGKKQLVATSGDGTLSVLDVRSNRTTPLSQSEDQEDELLSATTIKGGKKLVVGTQLGPLLIYDSKKGYADCVDRFLGHPQSVECIVSISNSPLTQNVIATGSSDGLIRVVQIHPSKFLGVIAEHGSSEENEGEGSEGLPVERMKVDRKGKWLGSISHDEVLKLTDIEGALEGSGGEDGEASEEEAASASEHDENAISDNQEDEKDASTTSEAEETEDEGELAESVKADSIQASNRDESSEDEPVTTDKGSRLSKKRRRKEMRREQEMKRKRAAPANTFFADL